MQYPRRRPIASPLEVCGRRLPCARRHLHGADIRKPSQKRPFARCQLLVQKRTNAPRLRASAIMPSSRATRASVLKIICPPPKKPLATESREKPTSTHQHIQPRRPALSVLRKRLGAEKLAR